PWRPGASGAWVDPRLGWESGRWKWAGKVRVFLVPRRRGCPGPWRLLDRHPLGIAELVRAGDHDAVAFGGAGEDFDVTQAAGAGLHRAAHGAAALDHPGHLALVHERAALDHQHVLTGVQHDARGQALVLAQ